MSQPIYLVIICVMPVTLHGQNPYQQSSTKCKKQASHGSCRFKCLNGAYFQILNFHMYPFLKLICLRMHLQVTSILSLFRLSQSSCFYFTKKKAYFSPIPNLAMVPCSPPNPVGKSLQSIMQRDNSRVHWGKTKMVDE